MSRLIAEWSWTRWPLKCPFQPKLFSDSIFLPFLFHYPFLACVKLILAFALIIPSFWWPVCLEGK